MLTSFIYQVTILSWKEWKDKTGLLALKEPKTSCSNRYVITKNSEIKAEGISSMN